MVNESSVFEPLKFYFTVFTGGKVKLADESSHPIVSEKLLGWLVGCFGLYGHLRQYFSLCRAVSEREGERKEK